MVFVIGLDLEAQPLKDIPHVADGDVEDGDEWDGVEGGGGGILSWRLLRRGGEASSSGLSPHQGTRNTSWGHLSLPRTPISPKSTLLLFSLWRILRVSTWDIPTFCGKTFAAQNQKQKCVGTIMVGLTPYSSRIASTESVKTLFWCWPSEQDFKDAFQDSGQPAHRSRLAPKDASKLRSSVLLFDKKHKKKTKVQDLTKTRKSELIELPLLLLKLRTRIFQAAPLQVSRNR